MRFPIIPHALLAVDAVTVTRPQSGTDANGRDTLPPLAVPSVTRGFYSLPSATDQATAGQRGDRIDAVVVFPPGADVRNGDRLTVRGSVFDVLTIEDSRNRLRVHIRKVTT